MSKPRIVILGGGFGGLAVARGLRKLDADITLVDRSNHHLFQPLLYQVATAGLSPADIATPIRSILRRQSNAEVLMAEVKGLDLQRKQVLLGGRELRGRAPGAQELGYQELGSRGCPYDILVVALGARYHYFGHDYWSQIAPSLKSVVDATRIRKQILLSFEAAEMETDPSKRQALLTFVVVGAGPTGVELAGSLAELAQYALKSDFRHIDPSSARIILIEAGPRVLASFPENLAERAMEKLRALGIEIRTSSRVENVDAMGVSLSGTRIEARTVLWSAGVVASPAGKWLNAETDHIGRVKVNPDLSVPGHPEIFVVGDTACVMNHGKPLPGIAPVALQEGRYVAKLICERVNSLNALASSSGTSVMSSLGPFRYFDKGNLATVGRTFAVADLGRFGLSGWVAWLTWVVVHIYYLIGFRNRMVVLIEWAWAYLTFQRGARLITDDADEFRPSSVSSSSAVNLPTAQSLLSHRKPR